VFITRHLKSVSLSLAFVCTRAVHKLLRQRRIGNFITYSEQHLPYISAFGPDDTVYWTSPTGGSVYRVSLFPETPAEPEPVIDTGLCSFNSDIKPYHSMRLI